MKRPIKLPMRPPVTPARTPGSFASLAIVLGLSACQSTAVAGDVPARIVNPSDESRAALQVAVNQALGTEVLLADDALTDRSTLVIERNIPRTLEGQPAQGRIMETPIRFQLVRNGNACVLVDTRSGTRYLLEAVECQPE